MSTPEESPGLKPWPLVWTILLGHVIITDYREKMDVCFLLFFTFIINWM